MLITAANWQSFLLYQFLCFQNRNLGCIYLTLFARKRGLAHLYFLYENESLRHCLSYYFRRMTTFLVLEVRFFQGVRFLRGPFFVFLLFDFVFTLYRSSHQRCSVKKVFLEISQNSQENTCVRDPFLIKLQACCEISKNTFFTEHLRTVASHCNIFFISPTLFTSSFIQFHTSLHHYFHKKCPS